MRTLTKLMAGVATAAALAVTAGAANAALTFTAMYSYDGGPLQNLNSILITPSSGWFQQFDVGNFSSVTLQGSVTQSPLFGTSSAAVTATGPGDLDLFLTVQGLTAPLGAPELWQTSITQNDLPIGWTVDTQAWLDPNDGVAVGSTLGDLHFVGTGGLFPTTGITNSQINTGHGPYSISTEYNIHVGEGSPLSSQSNSNIQVYGLGAIPEPATWGLMLVGFGGAGAMLRRRRAVAAAA